MTDIGGASVSGGFYIGKQKGTGADRLERCGWVLFGVGMSVAMASTIIVVGAAAIGEWLNRRSKAYMFFLCCIAAALVAVMIQVMWEVYKGFRACDQGYLGVSLREGKEVVDDRYVSSYEYEIIRDGVVAAKGVVKIRADEKEVSVDEHGEDCVSCMPDNVSDLLNARKVELPYEQHEHPSAGMSGLGNPGDGGRVQESDRGEKPHREKLFSSVSVGTADIIEFRSFGDNVAIYGVNSSKIHGFSWVNSVWQSFREEKVFIIGTGPAGNRVVALQVDDSCLKWPDFGIIAHRSSDVWPELEYDVNLVCNLKFPPGYDMQPGRALLAIPDGSYGRVSCDTKGEIFYKVNVRTTYNSLVSLMFSYENMSRDIGEVVFFRYLGVFYDRFNLGMLANSKTAADGMVTVEVSDGFLGSMIGRQFATDIVRNRDGFHRGVRMYGESKSYLVYLCDFFKGVEELIPESFHVHDDDMRSGTLFDDMGSIYALTCGRSSGYFVEQSPAGRQTLYCVFFSSYLLRTACIFQDINSRIGSTYGQEQSYFSSCISGLGESISALLNLLRRRHDDIYEEILNMYDSEISRDVLGAVALSSCKFSNMAEEVLKTREGSSYDSNTEKRLAKKLLARNPSKIYVMSSDYEQVREANEILATLVPYAVVDTVVAFLNGSKGDSILRQIAGEHLLCSDNEIGNCCSLRDLSDWAVVHFITRDLQSNFGGLLSATLNAHVLPLSGSSDFCGILLPVSPYCSGNSNSEGALVEQSRGDHGGGGIGSDLRDINVDPHVGCTMSASRL